jgi:hypothetical protein
MELQKTYGKNNVKILSDYKRLREIAASLGIEVLREKSHRSNREE